MKKFKLWLKLFVRQWSWHNDKDMVVVFGVFGFICSVIGFISYQIPIYVLYPTMLIFFIIAYHISKFCIFFTLCALIVLFIDDRRMQMQYGIMYNWRQPPKNQCNLSFNTTGEEYVTISRSIGDNQ